MKHGRTSDPERRPRRADAGAPPARADRGIRSCDASACPAPSSSAPRHPSRPLAQSRSAVALALLLGLAACGDADREPTPPGLIPRRADVPFGDARPTVDVGSLAEARRIDEIEKLIDQGLDARAQDRLTIYFADGLRHPRACDLQGRLLVRRGDRAGAVPWFEKAVEASPRWFEPRVRLADCYLKLERLLAAEQVFREIDHLAPKRPWGPYGMAAVAHVRGETQQAIERADEALRRDGDHGPTLRLRAELARVAGDRQLEERLVRRYVAVEPEDAEGIRHLADLDLAAGRPTDARRGYERAWELDRDPTIARRLTELAQARGDAADAARWRERAGLPKAEAPPGPKDGGAQRQ